MACDVTCQMGRLLDTWMRLIAASSEVGDVKSDNGYNILARMSHERSLILH